MLKRTSLRSVHSVGILGVSGKGVVVTIIVDGATVETTDGAAVLVLVPDIAEIRRQHNKLIVEIVQIRYMLIYQHLSRKKTLSLKKNRFYRVPMLTVFTNVREPFSDQSKWVQLLTRIVVPMSGI